MKEWFKKELPWMLLSLAIAAILFPWSSYANAMSTECWEYPKNIHTSAFKAKYPMHWAAHDGDSRKVQRLLIKGVDADALSWQGETPLDWAVKGLAYTDNGNQITVMTALVIQGGADIDKGAVDCKGKVLWSPLTSAVGAKCVTCIQHLLHLGADPRIVTIEGQDAIGKAHATIKNQEWALQLAVDAYNKHSKGLNAEGKRIWYKDVEREQREMDNAKTILKLLQASTPDRVAQQKAMQAKIRDEWLLKRADEKENGGGGVFFALLLIGLCVAWVVAGRKKKSS